MSLLIAEFAGLSLVIIIAGVFLARAADQLGERMGLGRSMAGLVLLAAATSLPELAIDSHAAAIGAADLAVGDLLGSSLFNLLILSLLDLATETRGRMLSRAAAAHAMSATASILLTVIALVFLLIEPPDFGIRVGPGSLSVALAYCFALRLIYVDQQFAAAEKEPDMLYPHVSTRRAAAVYLMSAAAIFVAAPALASTAQELVIRSGWGGTFFGTAVLGLITSLPEVATTLSALRIGAVDLAVGNILGSNSFNMVILLAVDLFQPGPLLASVSDVHAVTAGMVILTTSVAILGLLYRAEKRYWILEPDAVSILLLVLGALMLVYAVEQGH